MKLNFDCTVIILSYNSLEITDKCLKRLEAAIKHCEKYFNNKIAVTVVDNGSKDGSPDMIREKYKFVNLIALKENVGYVEGNNMAMREMTTPYCLLMNSDTFVEEDSLTKTFKVIEENSKIDALVCRWNYANGKLQIDGGNLPTPLRTVLWSLGFESLPVINKFLHKIYGYNRNYYKKEGQMEWNSVVYMLIKKDVYDKTKGFDRNLWFHMVDIEWCKRILDNGFKIWYTPHIQVTHLGGASSKGLDAKLLKDNFKGVLYFYKKHYPNNYETVIFFLNIGLKIRSNFYNLVNKKDLAKTYREIADDLKTQWAWKNFKTLSAN